MKMINFGSCNLDYVYEVPHFLRPGETLASTKYSCYPGGKGLNQSIAMARAGAPVYHAGKIGQDGGILLDTLKHSGVLTEYLSVGTGVTGHAIIQISPKGENCILLYGGSNLDITKEDVDRVLAHFGRGDMLVLQNEINQLEYILEQASVRGMQIVFNPSPISEGLKAIEWKQISWLILNELEGFELTGQKEADEILTVLLKRQPDLKIVLTMGKEGAVYQDRFKMCQQPGFPVQAIDTTGAGDTFTGYFICEIAAGKTVEEALKIAALAASLAVSREGASCSIPVREEVMKELEEKFCK